MNLARQIRLVVTCSSVLLGICSLPGGAEPLESESSPGRSEFALAQTLEQKGNLCFSESKYSEAQNFYAKALKKCSDALQAMPNDPLLICEQIRILRKQGELEGLLCKYQQALEDFDAALSKCDSQSHQSWAGDELIPEVELLLSRGRLNNQFLFFDKAQSDYQKALDHLSAVGKNLSSDYTALKQVEIMNQMAETKLNLGDYRLADQYVKKSQAIITVEASKQAARPKFLLVEAKHGLLLGELKAIRGDFIWAMSGAYSCISSAKKALEIEPDLIEAKLIQSLGWVNFSKYSACHGSRLWDSVESLDKAIGLTDDIENRSPGNVLSLKYKSLTLLYKVYYLLRLKEFKPAHEASLMAIQVVDQWLAITPLSAKAHLTKGLALAYSAEFELNVNLGKPVDVVQESLDSAQAGAALIPNDCQNSLLFRGLVIQKIIPVLKTHNQAARASQLISELKQIVETTTHQDHLNFDAKRQIQELRSSLSFLR